MKKWLVIAVVAAVTAVVVILAVHRAVTKRRQAEEFAKKVEPAAAAEVTKPIRGPVEEERSFLGKVISTDQVTVFSKIPGKVVAVPVKVGTRVAAGGTVAVIDYDQPGMKFRYYDAYSPIAGEVAAVMVSTGDVVAPTTPLAVVVKPASVKVQFSVPGDVLARLTRGTVVRLRPRGASVEVTAEVVNLPTVLSVETHMALVEARPKGEVGGLRAGTFCEVLVPVGRKEDALLIPPQAIRREGGSTVVYVVAGDRMRRRPVTVGLTREDAAEVASGLRAGEEVVVFANRDLEDGLKIIKKVPYRPHR